jgi:hypothetical protein
LQQVRLSQRRQVQPWQQRLVQLLQQQQGRQRRAQ